MHTRPKEGRRLTIGIPGRSITTNAEIQSSEQRITHGLKKTPASLIDCPGSRYVRYLAVIVVVRELWPKRQGQRPETEAA
jgi:hypothetical protein